jgi:hypothetical protein
LDRDDDVGVVDGVGRDGRTGGDVLPVVDQRMAPGVGLDGDLVAQAGQLGDQLWHQGHT